MEEILSRLMSRPPYTFGITTSGDFTITWSPGEPADGMPRVRLQLVVEASEVSELFKHLEELKEYQRVLASKAGSHGAH